MLDLCLYDFVWLFQNQTSRLHNFSWHGVDPKNKTRFVRGIHQFKVLKVIPDQFYYNVRVIKVIPDQFYYNARVIKVIPGQIYYNLWLVNLSFQINNFVIILTYTTIVNCFFSFPSLTSKKYFKPEHVWLKTVMWEMQ